MQSRKIARNIVMQIDVFPIKNRIFNNSLQMNQVFCQYLICADSCCYAKVEILL